MQSTRALPADPIESPAWRGPLLAAGLAATVAVVLFVVSGLAVALLPWSGQPHVFPPFTGHRLVEGWAQWDSGWYYRIARDGYSYVEGQQSTVVFFPVYPLLMRVTAGAVGEHLPGRDPGDGRRRGGVGGAVLHLGPGAAEPGRGQGRRSCSSSSTRTPSSCSGRSTPTPCSSWP